MKKNAIIGKKQILTLAMVLALGAAVWLNVSYSTMNIKKVAYPATSLLGINVSLVQ